MPETTPKPLTPDDFEATYDGIPVCSSGEDGDMIALGHHAPEVALAAFNRHAREVLKIENVLADDAATPEELADLTDCITQSWGLAYAATEEEQDHLGWSWRLETATADTPGAIPYTFLNLG